MGASFTELVEQHAVAALVRTMRLERLVEEEPAWHVDLDAGWLRIGGERFRVDVVGTESHTVGTFVWAWADPSFSDAQTVSAARLRTLGARWGVEELLRDDGIPLDRVSGETAAMVASEEMSADGYFVAEHAEGAVAFLLRSRRLRAEPFAGTDLPFVLGRLTAGRPPFDVGRALMAFAEHSPDGCTAELGRREVVLRMAGGSLRVELDRRGRVKAIEKIGRAHV